MAGIAISYRREDTAWITGRMFDRLKYHYEQAENKETGEKPVVFLDYDSTPVGLDFREYIKGVVDHADILLALANVHRKLIIGRVAQHRVPTIYPFRHYVADGGLLSYGTDPADQFHDAASYVDRILKGENPANLPVQGPTKFKLCLSPPDKWVGERLQGLLLHVDESKKGNTREEV